MTTPLKAVQTSAGVGEIREWVAGDVMPISMLAVLGAVSQSGGVPTGAIIQRGSNANGSFVRLADGLQLCFCVLSTAAGSVVASGTAALGAVSFPVAFAAAPDFCYSAWGGSFVESMYCANSFTASTTSIYVRNLGASTITWTAGTSVYITAIGRWF